ncbi:alpha/beta fold hydrolase [Pedobacter sp. CG_S7]|uniref:alpha/beta hydrolase n=1 Tax=Pedobacter sp. CG_S7 TaxID=3143930 RepID=UPI003399215F
MKKIYLFVVVSLLTIFCVNAQTETNQTVVKFIKYYKANQPDSIFTLFSPEMKAALKMEGTKQFVAQLKGSLGEFVKSRMIISPSSQFTEFRLSFEKPMVEIALIIKDKLIAGIQQRQIEAVKNDPVEMESPDNFSVNNTFGNLSGTLILPKNNGKIPVVLMIGGSGPTDRNMNQGQALRSNSFLMLAKGLAENGIATVRYDKRGVGKSNAAYQSKDVKLDDFISDANLFIAKLKMDPRFSKVIVLGHSEGAAIGIMTSLATNPDALISLCGYKNDMAELLKRQLKVLVSAADFKITTEILYSLKAGKIVYRKFNPALEDLFSHAAQSFIMSTMKYNSTLEMSKIKIPVLVVGGTTDLQIGIDEAKQLAKANPKATLKLIIGMNHVLKAAPADRTLNLQTYNNPEIPIHKDLVPLLTEFISKVK